MEFCRNGTIVKLSSKLILSSILARFTDRSLGGSSVHYFVARKKAPNDGFILF